MNKSGRIYYCDFLKLDPIDDAKQDYLASCRTGSVFLIHAARGGSDNLLGDLSFSGLGGV